MVSRAFAMVHFDASGAEPADSSNSATYTYFITACGAVGAGTGGVWGLVGRACASGVVIAAAITPRPDNIIMRRRSKLAISDHHNLAACEGTDRTVLMGAELSA